MDKRAALVDLARLIGFHSRESRRQRGCDDVADIRGAKALGGGGHEDLRDGILTLPIALAIRDPKVALMHKNPNTNNVKILIRKATEALPAAEDYLDQIAGEAEKQLRSVAKYPALPLALIRHTRALSQR